MRAYGKLCVDTWYRVKLRLIIPNNYDVMPPENVRIKKKLIILFLK